MCLQEEALILEHFQEKFKDKPLVVLCEQTVGDSWAYSLKKLKGRCVRLNLLQHLTCVSRNPMGAESLVKLLQAFVPKQPIHLSLFGLSASWNDAAVSVLCELIASHNLMSLVSAIAFVATIL
jgi:hypothetical protein